MKRIINKMGLTCLVLLVAAAGSLRTGHSAVADFSDDDNLIIGARAIVKAQVLSLASRLDKQQDRIFTYITLNVEAVLKGDITERQIVIKEEGGEVAGQGSTIFGTPQFTRGERVLLYLDTWRDGSLRTYQMAFGKLSIAEDKASGAQTIVRSAPDVERPSTYRQTHTRPADDLALADYTNIVRARLAANWDRSQAFAAQHYATMPMLAQPAEYSSALRQGEMQPQFTLYYPVKSARWFEPDDNQPVTFYINPENAPTPSVMDDVSAGLNAWSTISGCTLRLVNGGAQDVCSSEREINTITFNDCQGNFGSDPDCAAVVARGGIRWTRDETKQVNGQTFVKITSAFISFNPHSLCGLNDPCNFREIVTHELGHAIGLGHSPYTDATMAANAHFDGRCATLMDDDTAGAIFVYPVHDLGPQPLIIQTESALPDAILGISYAQGIVASGGILPHTWSALPGFGILPTGLDLNPGGVITGVPLISGTFNFVAEVDDGAGSTLQRSYSLKVRDPISYDSLFLSQIVTPTTVQAGQTFKAILRWRNAGTQSWDGATVTLAPQNPANNTNWGVSRIVLPSYPGKDEIVTVQMTLTAPRTAGTYNFQWQMFQTGVGFFGQPSATIQIVVSAGPPTIDGATALQATAGTSFSYQFTTTGGTSPFIWSIASGALPAGLSLNAQTGLLSGTPVSAGSATFTAQVTDAAARTAQKTLSITVASTPPPTLNLDLTATIQAAKGTAFTYQPQATGGTPPYTWSLTGGALPAGLAFNTSTGAVTGTPSASGNFTITVTVRDQRGVTASGALQINVSEPATVPVITTVKYKVGKRKLIVNAQQIDANPTLQVDGLPVSSHLDAGALIAKPVQLSSGTHEIRVVNSDGTASQPFTLTVK